MSAKTEKPLQKKKKKHILRKILITILILAILAGAGFYAWANLRAKYTTVYKGYTATRGTISNAMSFSGNMSLKNSTTYTAPSAATVRNVYVAERDEVKKGDRLVRLSSGTTVTADHDGTVNQLYVEAGDEVKSGDSLLQLADFKNQTVSFRVDEYDISDVHVGDRCTITTTATEKTFESQVISINYISSSAGNVAYYTAKADLTGAEGVLPGMQVTVSIPQEEAADVVVLKMDALSFTPENKAFVYRQNDDETMREQEVEVGVSNGNYVEIKSGLEEGDTVYAVEEQEDTTVTSLFAGLFGGQQINAPQGMNRNNNNQNRQNRDWNPGGNMPQMPSGGGGSR